MALPQWTRRSFVLVSLVLAAAPAGLNADSFDFESGRLASRGKARAPENVKGRHLGRL